LSPKTANGSAASISVPNSDAPIIRRAIRYGIVLTIAVLVIGGLIGYLVAGSLGLVSALLGAGITAVFMGLTAVSFLVAGRLGRLPEGIAIYYGIILGTFLLKFVIFIVLIIWLRGQHWLNPTVFGFTVIAAVLGTLIVDILALGRGRVTYVDVKLPAGANDSPDKTLEDS
jgi:hypothetical protein